MNCGFRNSKIFRKFFKGLYNNTFNKSEAGIFSSKVQIMRNNAVDILHLVILITEIFCYRYVSKETFIFMHGKTFSRELHVLINKTW